MKTYRDLIVWQKSMAFVMEIYQLTYNFPREEIYGLISQIRRSAVSIPSNIAEGYGRKATGDYIRFLNIAVASLYEVQTQLEISRNLKYFSQEKFETIYEQSRELERMMSSLICKIGTKLQSGKGAELKK